MTALAYTLVALAIVGILFAFAACRLAGDAHDRDLAGAEEGGFLLWNSGPYSDELDT